MVNFKRWLRDCAITGAARIGYELVPSWKMQRQPIARQLRDLFARYRIDCVIDVGANLGQYRDLLREDVGYSGWILSFEPVAKYARALHDRATLDSKWEVFDMALGDDERVAPIHVTQSPGLNSFLAPRTDVVTDFWRAGAVVSEEPVTIRRLDAMFDDLVHRFGFNSPYLKLDTQGYDLKVIAGAGTYVERMRAIQTEASVRPIYADMPDHHVTISYLESVGFALSGMYPVTTDDELRLVEYDCILVNQSREGR